MNPLILKNVLKRGLIVVATFSMSFAWADDILYNSTARLSPQIIAAGITPTKLDFTDSQFDIVALVRPGVTPLRSVSFQTTAGILLMKMIPAGVLPNGDELYKSTFAYERGSLKSTISTAWGSQNGQYNIVVTDEAQERSHTYPYLMVGNFPALSAATKPVEPISYDSRKRYAPQVIMAGYSPAQLDLGDDQFDVIAIVRPGQLPIKQVVLKRNPGDLFSQAMTLAGELDNGDKVYIFTYTYDRGSLGMPEDGEVISYKDLWGPNALQFGIEVIDDAERHSHKFPDIEFGNYPELKR